MAFDWNFRNYKRDPLPFLNGSIINDETARNAAIQNAAQNMQGYNPLASTIASEAMEGYQPLNPATQGQLAAGASQAMQGYTPNSVGRPSVPNDMHGGMAQPDLNGYGESLQAASNTVAQAQAKEQKIAELQSEISALEARIKENTAKLQNFTGNADQIAAIEARKINRQDPTSIWRWKQERDTLQKNRIDDQKRIEAQKALNEAKEKVINRYKLDATLKSAKADPYMTRDQKKAMLMTLNDAMRDAQIHNDTEYMDKVSTALQELNNASSYEDLANGLSENYLKIKGMLGKKGGYTKDEAVKAVEELLNDPQYEPVFRNNPGLREQMLSWKMAKLPNKPASGWNEDLD